MTRPSQRSVREVSTQDRPLHSFHVQHIAKTPYTLDVYDIMHRPGEMRELEFDLIVPEAFGTAIIGVEKGAPLHVAARLESLHDGILVSVDAEVTAVGECGRCLIEVREPVQVEIRELFAYSEDQAFEYWVQDDHVDLEPVIRDAVVLALPFQPVCQDDCLGLCPQCGVRLLDEPGHQHEAEIDPRWGALSGLTGLADLAEPNPGENGAAAEADTDREKR